MILRPFWGEGSGAARMKLTVLLCWRRRLLYTVFVADRSARLNPSLAPSRSLLGHVYRAGKSINKRSPPPAWTMPLTVIRADARGWQHERSPQLLPQQLLGPRGRRAFIRGVAQREGVGGRGSLRHGRQRQLLTGERSVVAVIGVGGGGYFLLLLFGFATPPPLLFFLRVRFYLFIFCVCLPVEPSTL